MDYLSAPKGLDGVAKLWRLIQNVVGKEFWFGLILLCIVAAVSGYQVSFSITVSGVLRSPGISVDA